jgi:hypothetical protein
MDFIDFTSTPIKTSTLEEAVEPAKVVPPVVKESNSKKRRKRAKKIQQQEAEK